MAVFETAVYYTNFMENRVFLLHIKNSTVRYVKSIFVSFIDYLMFQITLMIPSVLCCGAIGMGLFGNDDLHNAMLQSIQAGNQLAALVNTVKNQVQYSLLNFLQSNS